VAGSLRDGKVQIAEFRYHRISALVRADDGHDAYLAITADGVPDPKVIAVILAAVPGVSADDWRPEPAAIPGLSTAPGEVIWSTCLQPEASARVLTWFPRSPDPANRHVGEPTDSAATNPDDWWAAAASLA
jgi:hypothetical protein